MNRLTTKQMIAEAKRDYDKVRSVFCKPIRSQVIFGRHGWNHLIRDGHGHRRSDAILRSRLHLIKFAPDVVRLAISAQQDIREQKVSGKLIPVTYTKLHGMVNGGKLYICVIIRQFPDGSPHYYSVWSLRKRSRKNAKKPN